MQDKSALQISDELRQYIELMVEEVVLKGEKFESHKKYLPHFCHAEGIEFEPFEKILTDFFDYFNQLFVAILFFHKSFVISPVYYIGD